MKHKLLKGALFGLLFGVLMVGTAVAGPQFVDIQPGATNIGSTDSVTSGFLARGSFTITDQPGAFGYFLSVYLVDSVAAASAADSVIFRLVRKPGGAKEFDSTAGTLITNNPNSQITVFSFALTHTASQNFPLSKHIPPDSMAIYPIGPGFYQWIVIGGRTTASHVLDKAYKFRAYVESQEAL